MSCCQDITLTVGPGGCPDPILDEFAFLTGASPIAPHRPGCFSKSYTIHVTAGTWLSIRLLGVNFASFPTQSPCSLCDTYLYLVDSGGAIVAENDDAAMGLGSHIDCLIEIEDDYTIECTTFTAGETGTIKTTVNDKALVVGWAGNSASAGTGTSQPLIAPQSVAPLTWSIVGSLPSGLTLDADFSNPVFGKKIFGTTDSWGFYQFKIRVTDGNGMIREQPVCMKVIAFDGYRVFPTFVLAPPLLTPYSFQMAPIGGVAPYIFAHNLGTPPTGIIFDITTGTYSGIWTGGGMPTSTTEYIQDSQGEFSSVGISWVTCTGQNPVNNLTWAVTPTTPIPPGDTVTGGMAGGDGVFDLVNIYPGFGPCAQDPTRVNLVAQLCNPTATDYEITLDMRFTGTLENSPACPGIGKLQIDVQGLGFFPPLSITGPGIYDGTLQTLTARVPSFGVVDIGILVSVTYGDCHLTVTIRPLTPP